MKNIIDVIHLKTKIDRNLIATILTETFLTTKETLKEGGEVYWPGLCKFTWKVTKRGRKPKIEPEEKSKEGHVDGTGFEDIILPEIVEKEK